MLDPTESSVKLKRLQQLQSVLEANVLRFSRAMVGSTQKILVEGRSRKSADDLMGRTECNRIVNFPGGPHAARLVGQLIDVNVTEAYPHSLRAEVATSESVMQPASA